MEIRKIQEKDANNYLEMLLNLDKETKNMMFEPGERSTDISIVKGIINNSVNGDNLVLVAIDEGDIVGFLSAQRGGPIRVRHSAYIVCGIREKYRWKGIGSKLFESLDNWSIENQITRLELTVICTNTIAKRLYEKYGFEIEGIKKNTMIIDGKYIDEFCMAKLY